MFPGDAPGACTIEFLQAGTGGYAGEGSTLIDPSVPRRRHTHTSSLSSTQQQAAPAEPQASVTVTHARRDSPVSSVKST